MKYKKTLFSLLLILLFIFEWLFLNRNYLPALESDGLAGLITITTSSAGYNYLGSHGTSYALIYMLFLREFLTRYSIQYFVRKKRSTFLGLLYKNCFYSSVLFATIFMCVQTLLTTIYVEQSLLQESNFYIGAVCSFLMLIIYYYFVGILFVSFDIFLSSKAKATVVCFSCLAILTYLSKMYGLWCPVIELDIFDLLFADKLDLITIVIRMFTIGSVNAFITYCTYIMFKDKDIIHETN